MPYILPIYMDEYALDQTERKQCFVEPVQLTRDLNSSGQYLAAAPQHPTPTATSVRVREGKRLVTDGCFAETREQLGGYYLIEAKNLDDAMAVAARIPGARRGTVEAPPVVELAGMPQS